MAYNMTRRPRIGGASYWPGAGPSADDFLRPAEPSLIPGLSPRRGVSGGMRPPTAAVQQNDAAYHQEQGTDPYHGTLMDPEEIKRERKFDIIDEIAAFAGNLAGDQNVVETARYHQQARRETRQNRALQEMQYHAAAQKAEQDRQEMELKLQELQLKLMGTAQDVFATQAAHGQGSTSFQDVYAGGQQALAGGAQPFAGLGPTYDPVIQHGLEAGQAETARGEAKYAIDQQRGGFDARQAGAESAARAGAENAARLQYNQEELNQQTTPENLEKRRKKAVADQPQLEGRGGIATLNDPLVKDMQHQRERLNPPSEEPVLDENGFDTGYKRRIPGALSPEQQPQDEAIQRRTLERFVARASQSKAQLRLDSFREIASGLPEADQKRALDRLLAIAEKHGDATFAQGLLEYASEQGWQ